jgi:DNA replication licensing factor MCM3
MAAEEILRFALFKEVLKPERRKRRKLNNGQIIDEDEEEEEDAEGEEEEVVDGIAAGVRDRAREKNDRLDARRSEVPAVPSPAGAQPEEDDIDMEGAEAELALEQEVAVGEISADR